MSEKRQAQEGAEFSAAEVTALSHLYRGEVYRSTIWRTRLDTTTNWSVVTLGVALSITFSSPEAAPLPLVLVGVLVLFFLSIEARRYRYFSVCRARARWMEKHFFATMLAADGDLHTESGWPKQLAEDYRRPRYHVSYLRALARRVRSNYLWILLIQTVAYIGKLIVHPVPAESLAVFVGRAAIGPVPGWMILAGGVVYIASGVGLAVWVSLSDRRRVAARGGTRVLG
jgi:uncharacterized membrane protein